MKKLLMIVWALMLVLAVGCGQVADAAKAKPAVKQEQTNRVAVKLDHAIDGDTFSVKINGKKESVRFLLVDTPETNHPKLGKQPFGDEAKKFTADAVKKAKKVELEFDVTDRDKYQRLLAYVYVDGKSLQEMLLAKGYARVAYVFPPNVKYVDQYREIQKKAQKAGLGIWSVENYAQENGFHPEVIKKGK